ncbi:MAG: hypothetical protein [Caudoviricetes sp.]|nr:MAG: hypothetical protein [Caudoviricetes sp.]
MAYIPDGAGFGYFLTVTLQDRNMDYATLTYELRATNDIEAEAERAAIFTALGDVSQGVIVGYALSERYVNDSIGIPAAGEVEVKARVSYQMKDSFHKGTFDIPAPKETIFVATTGKGNKVLDITNADVIAYADVFRAAGVSYIGGGNSLEYLLEGRKVTSRSGLRSK